MASHRTIAALLTAIALGGCAVAPSAPYPRPMSGVYVEQGPDGSPSYIAQDIAAYSGEAPIVTGPDVRVVPGWSAYGGYGYAPYAYPPLPGSSVFFSWRSAPAWRPYPYAYPGRPGMHPHAPPAVAVPRAGPPPAVAPRPAGPPPGYRGPYRGLMGARK